MRQHCGFPWHEHLIFAQRPVPLNMHFQLFTQMFMQDWNPDGTQSRILEFRTVQTRLDAA
jgi:hypothetical protein